MGAVSRVLRRNRTAKLLAVIAAVALWSRISLEDPAQMEVRASISHLNVPDGAEINPDEAAEVSVVIEGRESQVEQIAKDGLVIEVDFDDTDAPAERVLTVTRESLGLPGGVRFVKAVPSQLRLRLEPTATREVEVAPEFLSAHGSEYELAGYVVRPERLRVAGPQERVTLVEAVSAGPIDLSEAVGRQSFRATALLGDPYLRIEGDPVVTVDVQMRRR